MKKITFFHLSKTKKSKFTALSGRLVSGKPYLLKNGDTNEFQIVYWIESKDKNGNWIGSDFSYNNDETGHPVHIDINRFRDFLWELPGVKYGRPDKSLRHFFKKTKKR